MPTVAIDARDARRPELRGWGRYTRELVDALRRDPGGLDIEPLYEGGAGPELLFEQVRLPRTLRRLGAGVVHTPNAFLPLRRPCPGVVTIHDLAFEEFPEDFSGANRVEVPHVCSPRRPVGRARDPRLHRYPRRRV